MNGAKSIEMFDLRTEAGRRSLRRVLERSDVVITSARRRAIDQLDLGLDELIATGRPRIWLSITGYGVDVDRIAFGDDAAVAGGLVAWDDDGPCFVADAVADPCTGLAGAAAVMQALEAGGRWLLGAAMADVAATLAGAR